MVALDIIHHEEIAVAAGIIDIGRRDDVRVPDARREARLVEEHRDEFLFVGKVRVKDLDGDESLETRDALSARDVHSRHSTRGELSDHFVAAEPSSGQIARRFGIFSRCAHQNRPSTVRDIISRPTAALSFGFLEAASSLLPPDQSVKRAVTRATTPTPAAEKASPFVTRWRRFPSEASSAAASRSPASIAAS